MQLPDMKQRSEFLERILSSSPDYEREVVERYSSELLELARRQLPAQIRSRVDPDDVVQSVYRTFFRRQQAGEFAFDETYDVWRLLATITYRKARSQITHHRRQQRDAFREASDLEADAGTFDCTPEAEDVVVLIDLLEKALSQLPEHHHELVNLRLQGFSVAEVAEKVSVSERTVLRVLARLKKLIADLAGT